MRQARKGFVPQSVNMADLEVSDGRSEHSTTGGRWLPGPTPRVHPSPVTLCTSAVSPQCAMELYGSVVRDRGWHHRTQVPPDVAERTDSVPLSVLVMYLEVHYVCSLQGGAAYSLNAREPLDLRLKT